MTPRTERPHKSTTHEEMFIHINERIGVSLDTQYKGATVFFRKEDDGFWYASAAYCSIKDQFNRRVGRSQARRRYFASRVKDLCAGTKKPDYETAKGIAYALMPVRN